METENLELRLQFDRVQRVLLVTMGGVITEETIVGARSAVRLFLKVQDPRSVIADLSLVERIEVSGDSVHDIANRPSALAAERPVILVAPKDATYGMSRMYQILRNTPNLEVVHSMKEALGLLRLKQLNFERAASV